MSTQLNRSSTLPAYTDSRTHGYKGPSRYARAGRVAPPGGASMSKNEDGSRCAVAGRESLRVVTVSTNPNPRPDNGARVEVSRNFWENSGLKIDSASTDVAWGRGAFNNKILTSARNGEIILWHVHKSGNIKYERRTKDHIRSINKLSLSPIVHYYCVTGSADGDMRVWDLRDLSKSVMRVKHPTSIRSIVFSPSAWQPLQAIVGLDNGSIHRWDLKMGQRGALDRVAVAHSAPITSLDWCESPALNGGQDTGNHGMGWLVSGGLDRCVKIWDLTKPGSNVRMVNKPTYTLHPSYPVKRVAWRPGYECELAVVSNEELSVPGMDSHPSLPPPTPGLLSRVGSGLGLDSMLRNLNYDGYTAASMEGRVDRQNRQAAPAGETIELWDVRREYVAKWSVSGSSAEGSISDAAFGDSHTIWAQHSSGSFTQFDLRESTKPMDAINRVSTTWNPNGSVTFITDNKERWEVPYDDVLLVPPRQQEARKASGKALGDPSIRLDNQIVGLYVPEDGEDDPRKFAMLAREYALDGSDKGAICHANALTALRVGDERAFQVWNLLATSLVDYTPTPPVSLPQSPQSRSRRAPSSGYQSTQPLPLSNYAFPGPSDTFRRSPGHSMSRNQTGQPSRSRSVSRSRVLTPSSSNASSPLHLAHGLPPSTPNRAAFPRRESTDSGILRRPPGSHRRPSLSTNVYAASPSEKPSASSKHVGEGALDDSSSSDESEPTPLSSEANVEDFFTSGTRNVTSPVAMLSRQSVAAPSPLSKVVGQQRWTEEGDSTEKERNEDEDGDASDESESSPSPRSTDTESEPPSSHARRPGTLRAKRSSFRGGSKSRSRSSTLASLTAGPPRLVQHPSQSSIRTITTAEPTGRENEEFKLANREESLIESSGHKRQKSYAYSDLPREEELLHDEEAAKHQGLAGNLVTKRHRGAVKADDQDIQTISWDIIREALEEFAEEGDVQTCASISIVAQEELRLPLKRACRFIESYIERLMQSRLYTRAAYIRKISNIEHIRNRSLEETVIYTICGKCNKPLMKPAPAGRGHQYGTFSYCSGCKSNTVVCSICHLPVRSLLFQCSVCKHGGHQACYRQFYLTHPMVDLPSVPFLPGFGFGSGSSAGGQHLHGHGGHLSSGSGVLRTSASSSDLLLLSSGLPQYDSGRGRTLSRESLPRSSGASSSTSTSASMSSSLASSASIPSIIAGSAMVNDETSNDGHPYGSLSSLRERETETETSTSGGSLRDRDRELHVAASAPTTRDQDLSSTQTDRERERKGSATGSLGSARGSVIGSSAADGDESVSGKEGSVGGTTGGERSQSPSRAEGTPLPRLMGHPCAAGCGHFCWAANTILDQTRVS
ncbi:hypothetical protein BKA70DRAFT_1271501 [Coprinopsis sp. MPI-PUGE-AT-0042]|nr:hypothetical protein BKA70DRAFT_1271501 [Coprinopsis sp. MPI-PUGE-AT-0042]